MTRPKTERNPDRTDRSSAGRRLGPLWGAVLALSLFAAGWLAGRRGCAPAPAAKAPSHSSGGSSPGSPVASGAATVQLRLDASAVTLLPEGGLELRPLSPLDAGGASPDAGSSPEPGQVTRP